MKLLMILLIGIGIFAFSGCGETEEERLNEVIEEWNQKEEAGKARETK